MSGRKENEQNIEKTIARSLQGSPSEIRLWNELMRASGLTAVTRRDRIQKVKAFLSGHELTREGVISYMTELREKDVTDTYRTSVWYTLNSFCTYLYNEGITPINFMSGISRSRNNDTHAPVKVTAKDFTQITAAVSEDKQRYGYAGGITLRNRDRLMLAILIETGIRETALTSIDVGDLDGDHIVVIEKGNTKRSIYLSDKTVTILNEWLEDRRNLLDARQKKTDALFVSRDGDRISHDTVRYVTKKYSGNKLSPHKVRGGYCSILYDKTHDIEFVRRAVGHRYASTTQRYISTDDQEARKGMEIINKIL